MNRKPPCPRQPRARRHTAPKVKRPWPSECFTLPGSVEEIERGIMPEVQEAREWYGADLLSPIGGALVAVPVPQHAQDATTWSRSTWNTWGVSGQQTATWGAVAGR